MASPGSLPPPLSLRRRENKALSFTRIMLALTSVPLRQPPYMMQAKMELAVNIRRLGTVALGFSTIHLVSSTIVLYWKTVSLVRSHVQRRLWDWGAQNLWGTHFVSEWSPECRKGRGIKLPQAKFLLLVGLFSSDSLRSSIPFDIWCIESPLMASSVSRISRKICNSTRHSLGKTSHIFRRSVRFAWPHFNAFSPYTILPPVTGVC